MESKKVTKISTSTIIFSTLLLAAVSFYAGMNRGKAQSNTPSATQTPTNSVVFAAEKSDKPTFNFFVMSFCPYGNQAEDILRPVYDLLGQKVNLQPQYIFDKIDNLNTYCQTRSGDPAQCSLYVQNKYFTTEAECKKAITDNLAKCKDEKSYIKASTGTMYGSLHGRQEATEDVREMCAFNLAGDNKLPWWDFVGLVNQNCTAQNADTCWEDQAKKAGFDTNKITDCFTKEGINLIETEIALTTKFNVSGSPTLLINNVAFPPQAAYTQDGKGSLKLDKVVVTQDKYRTPNTLKEAICASFKNPPKECKTQLAEPSNTAPAGGC